jgi:glycosyltransferase involved in cell wall biosynthesis
VVARDGDRDGLPNVLLEAAAIGVPIVATDVGGIPDLVRDGGTGLVAKPGDPEDLAGKIEAALGDPQAAMERARRARVEVEARFDAERQASKLIEALGLDA